jgi:hypothetical protein
MQFVAILCAAVAKENPMPHAPLPPELALLVERIAEHPDGVGIDTLLHGLGDSVQRRTLQRRLAALVAQGRISKTGQARAARYLPAPPSVSAMAPVPAEIDLPTSPEGRDCPGQVISHSPIGCVIAD